MATQDFRVYVAGGTVSLDAWRQAMEATERQLPPLSEAQREAARIIEMSEPEYARGVLADQIGKERQQEIGRRLGTVVGEILDRIGPGWKLESLVRKGADFVWLARIESAGLAEEVEIPVDLADDVVDSGEAASRNRLERLLSGKLDSPARRAAS
jgi:hypothetical protein